MIRQNDNSATSDSGRCDSINQKGCRDHHQLNQWQIRQYRKAVDENKWYMGQRLGRAVEWDEAEYDFLHNGYYGCAPKWRKEYCTSRCDHYPECRLGKLFSNQ